MTVTLQATTIVQEAIVPSLQPTTVDAVSYRRGLAHLLLREEDADLIADHGGCGNTALRSAAEAGYAVLVGLGVGGLSANQCAELDRKCYKKVQAFTNG